MRISTEKDDPGYRAYCIALGDNKKISIYLDGEPVKFSYTADDVEGFVVRNVMTPAGNFATDGERLLTEIVRGVVRIEIE